MCDCGYTHTTYKPVETHLPLIDIHTRERAALCSVCPHSTGRLSAWSCRLGGDWVDADRCPKGRHPLDDGTVHWAGILWYGVPYPVRLWTWWRGSRRIRVSEWPGCGCVVRLKMWISQLRWGKVPQSSDSAG